jgi:hypothetical protein
MRTARSLLPAPTFIATMATSAAPKPKAIGI